MARKSESVQATVLRRLTDLKNDAGTLEQLLRDHAEPAVPSFAPKRA